MVRSRVQGIVRGGRGGVGGLGGGGGVGGGSQAHQAEYPKQGRERHKVVSK